MSSFWYVLDSLTALLPIVNTVLILCLAYIIDKEIRKDE